MNAAYHLKKVATWEDMAFKKERKEIRLSH